MKCQDNLKEEIELSLVILEVSELKILHSPFLLVSEENYTKWCEENK